MRKEELAAAQESMRIRNAASAETRADLRAMAKVANLPEPSDDFCKGYLAGVHDAVAWAVDAREKASKQYRSGKLVAVLDEIIMRMKFMSGEYDEDLTEHNM